MVVNKLRGMLCLAGTVICVSACGSSAAPSLLTVPAEFRAACGHPGAHVMVRKVPVTISHAACDLTGVLITYRDYGGGFVPRAGGGTTTGISTGFTMAIQQGTLDVTINATGVPGTL